MTRTMVPEKVLLNYDVGEHGKEARIVLMRTGYRLPHGRPSFYVTVWEGWRFCFAVASTSFEQSERYAATVLAEVTLTGKIPEKPAHALSDPAAVARLKMGEK